MPTFTFKEPKLYKDPANKKWCIIYNIQYKGEPKTPPIKDYGRAFFGYSLNSIKDHKEREDAFNLLRLTILKNLKEGIDDRNRESVEIHQKAKLEAIAKAEPKSELEPVEESTPAEYHYDYCLNVFLQTKGYINPKPKQELSAVTYTSFLKGQFRQYLEKEGLLDDVRKITKKHLLNFTEFFTLHPDPKIKWSNNTFNNKRSYLGSFFSLLADRETITINPVTKLKRAKAEKTKRFEIFTREELNILFPYLKENNYFLYVTSKVIYHSFIRGSEANRMHVADFLIDRKQIRIRSEDAKGQNDHQDAYVLMVKALQDVLNEYLETYPHKLNWYMFGKDDKPSPYKINRRWYEDFGLAIEKLQIEHPKLFNRPNLTYYGLKHTGVTHFIEDHSETYSTTKLLQFVQNQCRHVDFKQTTVYWKQLGFQLDTFEDFKDL